MIASINEDARGGWMDETTTSYVSLDDGAARRSKLDKCFCSAVVVDVVVWWGTGTLEERSKDKRDRHTTSCCCFSFSLSSFCVHDLRCLSSDSVPFASTTPAKEGVGVQGKPLSITRALSSLCIDDSMPVSFLSCSCSVTHTLTHSRVLL